jgi:hypothetical protein
LSYPPGANLGGQQPGWQGQQPTWQGQQPTWGGQKPPSWNGQQPQFQENPGGRGGNRAAIIAIFIGVLIAIVAIAGFLIFVNRPPVPTPPCPPGRPCAPGPTLPPIASARPSPVGAATPAATTAPQPTPATSEAPTTSGAPSTPGTSSPAPSTPAPVETPGSNSPPVALGGSTWRSATLGYAFDYDSSLFQLSQSTETLAVFDVPDLNAQVVVDVTDDDITASEMIDREAAQIDTFLIARTNDNDDYDAVLGPGIGYVRGESAVYSGILLGADGTPVAPGGVTVMASANGRITVAVIVVVGEPDSDLGGDTLQHVVRDAVDDIVKSFDWGSAP